MLEFGHKKSFIGIIRAVFQSGDQRFAYAFAVFFVFRCCRIVDDAADSIFEGGILFLCRQGLTSG